MAGALGTMDSKLEFLDYIHKLKHLERTGWVRKDVKNCETISGHMYRMAVMSAFLVKDPSLDLSKCIKMSLVHDMGESIIGDITPHCGVDKETKAKMEADAMKKLSGLLLGTSGEEIWSLFQEYEHGSTPEAKIVKDLDRFDMVLQAYEYEQQEGKPRFLQEFFDATQAFFQSSHPCVKDLLQQLTQARDNNVPFCQK